MGACSPELPGDNGADETASTPVLPCANTPPCMGGPGLICPECPHRPAGWGAQTLDGKPAAAPRCPAVYGAMCAPDVTCECRHRANLRPLLGADENGPLAVPDTLRREALAYATKALPPTASPAELAAGAYIIGLFLHTGRA
jgi:hypothetical protein